MKISKRLLRELQTRLKVSNRGSVLLNAVPGKSKYKLDLKTLSFINERVPEDFLKELLSNSNFSFKISWKDREDYDNLGKKEKQNLYSIKESLDSLMTQAEVTESEKGINTFGFGFPILVRRDNRDNELIAAPIIIWSLKIERKRELNTWVISRDETDAIYVNEVLINHLLFDANIKIEKISPDMLEDGVIDKEEMILLCTEIIKAVNVEFSSDKEKSIRELFSRIEVIPAKDKLKSLVKVPNQSILFSGGLFSIFETQKQNLIKDYDCLISKENVQLGTKNNDNNDFQSLTSIETDPTQQGILDSIKRCSNILIQGPPGTGKSQTLTGVILNSLENGKKILVVCEKRTALEVLEEALKEMGLGKFCILIKDIFKDRGRVVDSVRQRIERTQYNRYTYTRSKNVLDKLIEETENLIEKVNEHHLKSEETLLEDKNWSFWVGERLKILKELGGEEALNLSGFNFQFSDKEFRELVQITSKGESLYAGYKIVEGFDFINPDALTGDNPFIIEKELKNHLSTYRQEFEGEDSRIRLIIDSNKGNLDFFDIKKTKKYRYYFLTLFNKQKRNTLKSQNELFKLCLGLSKRIEEDPLINFEIDKTTHESIYRDIVLLFKKSDGFFQAQKDAFINTFKWASCYKNLSEIQKNIVEELKLKNNWRLVFLENYLNSLLVTKASNKFLTDDVYINKLNNSLGSLKKEQISFIDGYWFSKEMSAASSFDQNNNGVSVRNLFNKRSSAKHKRQSLRQIVSADIDLFTSFFPVVLTTPDICSNLFEDRSEYFDIVLFDEASQLRLEDTLPAMLKGKQIIVAGDEHQMPPSNYFSKVLEGQIEDETDVEGDILELNKKVDVEENLLGCESLLEASDQMGFEERFLEFHYRSRHPYLIGFSNHAFYNNRLKPVPNNVDYVPLKLIQVDGTYSGYTNDLEADYVISVLENEIKKFSDGNYPSVGIATFNIHQRNLIKEKIEDKRRGAAQIFANNQATFLNSVFVSAIIFSHWWLHLTTLRLSIFCAPSLLHRCPACFILF